MADDNELQEYADSLADGTVRLIAVADALTDALTSKLGSDVRCAKAIQFGEAAVDALLQDIYPVGFAPFMQPAAADEPVEETGEDEAAAGSGDAAGEGRGRR